MKKIAKSFRLTASLLLFLGLFSQMCLAEDYNVTDETTLNSALTDTNATTKMLNINSDVTLTNNADLLYGTTITINGNNKSINGSGKAGIEVPGTSITTINDLTLNNFKNTYVGLDGTSIFGGALYNSTGTVNIYNSNFTNNMASGDGYGGAIDNDDGGSINIYNSTFSGNNATFSGGAINNSTGVVNIYNSTFTNNTTGGGGGAIVHSDTFSTFGIYNSTFGGPLSTDGNSASYGGAIYNYGPLVIDNSKFQNNKATNDGGAIYNSGGNITISNSIFKSNSASNYGGAIFNDGNLNIYDSSFANNIASVSGGAIYNLGSAYFIADKNDVDFKNNTAGLNGGAIYNDNDLYLIANNGGITFSGNTATSLGKDIYNDSNGRLLLNARGGEITFNDGIYSKKDIYINKSGIIYDSLTAPTTGRIVLNSALTGNGNVEVDGGTLKVGTGGSIGASGAGNQIGALQFGNGTDASSTILDLANGSIGNVNASSMTVSSNNKTSIWMDVDLTNSGSKSDTINTTGAFKVNGNLSLATVRMLHDAIDKTTVPVSVSAFGSGNFGTLTSQFRTYTNKYAYTVNLGSGVLSFDRGDNAVAGLKFAVLDAVDAERSFSLIGSDYMADSTYNLSNGTAGNPLTLTVFGTRTSTDDGLAIHGTSNYQLFTVPQYAQLNVVDAVLKYARSSTSNGAAINNDGILNVYNSALNNNVVDSSSIGGAIYNSRTAYISNSQFTGNSSIVSDGGAIYNDGSDATTNIYHSTFIQNNTNNYGGAVVNNGGKLIVSDSTFGGDDGTYANNAGGGGAIFSTGDTATTNIYNSIFNNNNAGHEGGAIDTSGTTINIYNSIFNNNTAGYEGGAIDTALSTTNIYNSLFSENKSNYGGAISVEGDEPIVRPNAIVTIYNSTFKNNAASLGGAIYLDGGIVNAISNGGNIEFTGNTATSQGGAIYAEANSAVNLIANGGNILFNGNKANDLDNDIYLNTAYSDPAHGHTPIISTLNLNANVGNNITFNGGILSATRHNIINVNKAYDSGDLTTTVANVPTNGEIVFNAPVDTATMNLYGGTITLGKDYYLDHNNLTILSNDVGAIASTVGGTLNLANRTIGTMNLNALTLTNSANLKIDVDLSAGKADTISADTISGNGKLNINYINLLSNKTGVTTTKITDSSVMYDKITLGVSKVLTPIYQYGVTYDGSGNLVFAGGGTGGGDFNPAILSGPVSANVGAYMTQVNTYNEALSRAEIFMSLPQSERLLMKQRNMYANIGGNDVQPEVFSPTFLPEENGGVWFKQYSSFENVPMNNGPNVSNVGYGIMVGADSQMYHLKNGYDGYVTAYVGYNGSHQNYDNVGVYQNGGALGLTGTLYKGNLFTALTASVGDSYGRANTMYGVDEFNTILAGLAWKTGYNIEMDKGKFILQPSLLAAYTFANTFDYTTASGVSMTSDPMNAIQIAPGVKFIDNMGNGWQPYLAANMVFNIMDNQKFQANDVQLPQMSIAPYVEYGLGIQRRWGERFTGFGQFMLRGGGRNGIAMQFGFRIAIGK